MAESKTVSAYPELRSAAEEADLQRLIRENRARVLAALAADEQRLAKERPSTRQDPGAQAA